MKRIHLLVLVIASLVFIGGCGKLGGESSGTPQTAQGENAGEKVGKPEKPRFKIPVTVDPVERGRMYAYLQAVGTVVPIKELELKPEMTGRIYYTRRWVEGDEVKKGDILATIDDRQVKLDINEAELQLQLAEAAVRPASAQLEQAIKDENFKQAMYERGAISKAEYDLAELTRIQRENSYEQALQNIKSRAMAVEKLRQEMEKVGILIPFTGVLLPSTQSVASGNSSNDQNSVTDLTMLNGQTVGASTVLCRLANIDKVYVALDIPAKDLVEVEIGQDVELEIYSRAGSEYKGTVADISTSLNASTRTYTVNVLVDNPQHELRPGMFAKARIITQEKLDAISIPRSMIQLRNNHDVVFVIKPKPQDEVRDATAPIDAIPQEEELKNKHLVMAGQGEGLAFAAENPEAGIGALAKPPLSKEMFEQQDWIAEERIIERGIENREEVEILSGLQANDLLVVLGYETLTDGIDVNVSLREDDPLSIESLE